MVTVPLGFYIQEAQFLMALFYIVCIVIAGSCGGIYVILFLENPLV